MISIAATATSFQNLKGDFVIGLPPGRLIDRIMVETGPALDTALAAAFDRRAHPRFPFDETMRQRDAIELLNIDPTRYQDIYRLLPKEARGLDKRLRVEPMLAVARRIIDQREAKARWGVRLPRDRMVEGGLGWSRPETEAAGAARLAQPVQFTLAI